MMREAVLLNAHCNCFVPSNFVFTTLYSISSLSEFCFYQVSKYVFIQQQLIVFISSSSYVSLLI